jgi:hypothetical protein
MGIAAGARGAKAEFCFTMPISPAGANDAAPHED